MRIIIDLLGDPVCAVARRDRCDGAYANVLTKPPLQHFVELLSVDMIVRTYVLMTDK